MKGSALVFGIAGLIAIIMAVLDAMSVSVWISATSWLIVAAVLLLFAILTKKK